MGPEGGAPRAQLQVHPRQHQGKIYVVGGRPPRGHDFAVYDPKADRWETLPDLPSQRNHIAAS